MTTPLPPFVPIANGAQMTVNMSIAGQEAVCVVGGFFTEPGPLDQVEGSRWLSNWFGNFKQSMSDSVTCTGAVIRDLRTQGGQVLEVAPPSSPVGILSAPLALGAACALVKWSTASGGRRGKGRSYIPGVTETETEPNGRTLTALSLGQKQQSADAYLTSMAPANGVISAAVISRADGTARQITGAAVGSVIAIQRRRMR